MPGIRSREPPRSGRHSTLEPRPETREVAFDVKPGDKYYLEPEERVRIW
jgi:hypothetical protein